MRFIFFTLLLSLLSLNVLADDAIAIETLVQLRIQQVEHLGFPLHLGDTLDAKTLELFAKLMWRNQEGLLYAIYLEVLALVEHRPIEPNKLNAIVAELHTKLQDMAQNPLQPNFHPYSTVQNSFDRIRFIQNFEERCNKEAKTLDKTQRKALKSYFSNLAQYADLSNSGLIPLINFHSSDDDFRRYRLIFALQLLCDLINWDLEAYRFIKAHLKDTLDLKTLEEFHLLFQLKSAYDAARSYAVFHTYPRESHTQLEPSIYLAMLQRAFKEKKHWSFANEINKQDAIFWISLRHSNIPMLHHTMRQRPALAYARYNNYPALVLAAAQGNLNVIQLLIDNGAKKEVLDPHGHSAYQTAECNEHHHVLDLLQFT